VELTSLNINTARCYYFVLTERTCNRSTTKLPEAVCFVYI